MALGNPLPLLLSTVGSYEIERSVRFNNDTDDSRFEFTPSGAGTSDKIFTFSCWIKRSRLGVTNQYLYIVNHSSYTDHIMFHSDDTLRLKCRDSNLIYTNRKFRDPSAWYHIVVNTDTTNGTADDRHQIWINGVRETSFSVNNNLNNLAIASNSASDHHIGGNGSNGFGGYMAEVHHIDGQQIDASNFGETDATTGAWIPKKYAGTYGTNGFYLNFKDNSGTTSTTLGKDSSGNGNNFTPQNFSVAAGTGNDSVVDTPTNNYCTLNPLIKPYGTNTFSEGALKVDPSNHWNLVEGTFVVKSGKWYWEQQAGGTISPSSHILFGIISHGSHQQNLNAPHGYNGTISYYDYTGQKRINNAYSTYGDSYNETGDVIGTALDMDNRTVTFYKNGTSQGSIDIDLANDDFLEVAPYCSVINATTATFNFGQRAFAYSVPADHKTLCAANLPEPTIKKPTDYFNTVLYTGNDSDGHARTGLGFQPNLVWIKDRGDGNHHRVYDSVRGVNAALLTSDGNAEDQYATYGQFESFDSDGFTVGIGTGNSGQRGEATNSAEPHVAWCWKESPSAGFDIVSYEGNGSGPRTISHNLGVKPHLIICKNREQDTNWMTYHKDVGAEKFVYLNTDAVEMDDAAAWNDTEPTETVFTVNADQMNNGNGDDIIAYVFTSVEGFSSFGVYEGNGATDGTFVYTGFRPSLVILKRVETTPNAYWNIYDSARDPYNSGTTADFKRLLAHSSGAEVTNHANYTPPDLLSNGFKLRHGSADKNYSGKKFIYLAFAETPFKYANAR